MNNATKYTCFLPQINKCNTFFFSKQIQQNSRHANFDVGHITRQPTWDATPIPGPQSRGQAGNCHLTNFQRCV